MLLLYNVPVNKASHFKVFPYSGIFLQVVNLFIYKYLQIALLLIFFCWYFAKSECSSFCWVFPLVMMLLLYCSKYSSFLSFSSKLAISSYRLQCHEGMPVQFTTCIQYFNFYATCVLHRPAFMTLEPIKWCCTFCREAEKWLVFLTVQQQHHY